MPSIWKEYFDDMYNTDTCLGLMGFGEANTSEERRLGELGLR